MKLYYNPRSRAVIAKWMLDECGVDYEIVPVDAGFQLMRGPEPWRGRTYAVLFRRP